MSFLGNHAVESARLARPGGDLYAVWGSNPELENDSASAP